MIYAVLNREKIWHANLMDLSTSPQADGRAGVRERIINNVDSNVALAGR